jgi:diaminopimelate decarboxylase
MSLRVTDWGFSTAEDGSLLVGGTRAETLAREYGTPLHIIDEGGLRSRARRFRRAFQEAYRGSVAVHYAFKCNNTPGVVEMILQEGLGPEVGTLYEWTLAQELGASPGDVVVNGPNKGALLDQALTQDAGLVVVDGFEELQEVEEKAKAADRIAHVLLRVNPNYIPKGMNRASATGSRKRSVFGFDLTTGEVERAFTRVTELHHVHFAGLHCHVGTGIREPGDYRRPLERLVKCAAKAKALGLEAEVLNVGGGFGVPTSRELNTGEFLIYQAGGRLPRAPRADRFPPIEKFATAVANTVAAACARYGLALPRLVLEPGRAIASGCGLLLVTVGSLKRREGVGTWAITDGGTGTVAFPLYYEYHEVFLCRAPEARRSRRYTLVGPVCFSADWIYRNKGMPPLKAGDGPISRSRNLISAFPDRPSWPFGTVKRASFAVGRPSRIWSLEI